MIKRWMCLVWLAALAPWWGQDSRAHGVSLNVYHDQAEDSAFHNAFFLPWVQKLEEASGGRLRFHVHAGVTGQSLYDKVKDGSADIVWTAVESSPGRFTGLAPVETPFLVRRAAGASRAVTEYVRLNDLADRDFDGVRLLAVNVRDNSQMHFTGTPPGSPQELAALRLGATSAAEVELLGALGARASLVSAVDAVKGMREGTLDGALLSWERLATVDAQGAAKSHVAVAVPAAGFASSVFVLAMNPGSFRALADDLRAVVEANSGPDTAAWIGRALDEAGASARAKAQARGDVTVSLAGPALKPWLEAGQRATEARRKALDVPAGRWRALLQSLRELLAELDPGS